MAKIAKIQVQNVRAIRNTTIEPDEDFTTLKGATGTGKTSILMAISAALGRKSDCSELVTDGENRAVILLEIDSGLEVRKTIKRGGGKGEVTLNDTTGELPRPQSELNKMLGTQLGLNPIDFLDMNDKKQQDMLLSFTDVEPLTEETVKALHGGYYQREIDLADHPLTIVATLQKALFDQRTLTNRELKEAEARAKGHARNVPKEFDPEAVAQTNLRELTEKLAAKRIENQELALARKNLQNIENEIERFHQSILGLTRQKEDAEDSLKGRHPHDESEIEAEIAGFQEQQKVLTEHRLCEEAEAEASARDGQAEELTGLIENLRTLPAEMIKAGKPVVSGIGIDIDGNVTIAGRPISDLSTGEQLDLAVELAQATAGNLKVLLIDRFESLDGPHKKHLLENARAAGFQVFVTEVSDGELTIQTDGKEAKGE